MVQQSYPVRFSVDYPDRELDRLSTALRIFFAIPILIVVGSLSGSSWEWTNDGDTTRTAIGAAGLLVIPPLLMIVFRQKYPRWWFDWNLELLRFTNRVWAYLALMDDRYPATDDAQSVHLDIEYPDAQRDLNRWLPLVKWILAIPHFFVLFFLNLIAIGGVIAAWFVILFTGRYPRSIFAFVEGVLRWDNRVTAYAMIMATDTYPPFNLG